jgi:hypothetical protein
MRGYRLTINPLRSTTWAGRREWRREWRRFMQRSMIFMCALCSGESSGTARPLPAAPACAGGCRAGYQVAAAGVSPVNCRKKDCLQKIVKNIGLEPPLRLSPKGDSKRSSPSQERRAGACRHKEIRHWPYRFRLAALLPFAPPPQSLFLPALPVPSSDRKSPFLVPSLQSRNYRSARRLSKRRLLGRRDRKIFCPFLGKKYRTHF